MTLNILILFFSALIAGLAAFAVPEVKGQRYKLVLVFAGAYLFSVTIIHILPELFSEAQDPGMIGLYVLGGFFLQQILEYFSSGVEHGHVHAHGNHHHKQRSAVMVLVALSIHSLLEGSILAHPSAVHAHHDAHALLLGIVLHKVPAAFALVTILLCQLGSKKKVMVFLLLFCMASPLGLFLGDYYVGNNMLSDEGFILLFAVVSGNFLHISTTIVFESSAEHKFNAKKLAVAIVGALVAVAAEQFL